MPRRQPDEYTVASFQRQYDLLSTIEHPGVVRVHDIGRDPAVVIYIVTEYFEFARLVVDGPVPSARVMEVVAQAADALQAVHDRGFVFRNIWKGLMTRVDGTAVLNDFHLAVPVGSPELEMIVTSHAAAWDGPATRLTDIYDLGRLAHFLLTLIRPGGVVERLNPLVWPDHIPLGVRAVVDRAVAVNAADRWPSAAALAEAARSARA